MKWTDDLSVGVDLIDTEHKSLIDAVNSLFDACQQGKGRLKINETLTFLQDYVKTHFGDEEKLQRECGYPDYENHCKIHAAFVKKVGQYSKRLQDEGANIALVADFNTFISGWLINHISREDKKIGLYILQQKK